jgi:hypothetical protein
MPKFKDEKGRMSLQEQDKKEESSRNDSDKHVRRNTG